MQDEKDLSLHEYLAILLPAFGPFSPKLQEAFKRALEGRATDHLRAKEEES
jgi:hypothetical protein